MANTLFPRASDSQASSQEAHSILDEMIYKGNRVAAARKAELTHLEMLFRELAARIERRGLPTLTLSSPVQNQNDEMGNAPTDEQQEEVMTADHVAAALSMAADASCSPSVLPPMMPSGLEFLDTIGISSYEFTSIVNQMSNPGSHSVFDPAQARRQDL